MEKIYKKITSIDIGSTNSQIAQRYEESIDGGKTWTAVSKSEDIMYLLRTEGEVNHPTELIIKDELTPEQLAQTGIEEDIVFGTTAKNLHKKYYQLPLAREFKKNLYYSEEEMKDSRKAERFQKAARYIELLFKCLKKREAQEQAYIANEEVTYVTVPVRADAKHREIMRELAEKAGWNNVKIRDEADSVLHYALSSTESSLFQAVGNSTCNGKVRIMMMDIGGSTTDLLLVDVRPDGNGSYKMDKRAIWPEAGEQDTLGGIDIDKKLCEWLLKEKYILPDLAEQSIQRFGYRVFTEFKEANSNILRMGANDGAIPQLIGDVALLCGTRKTWAENDYDEATAKKLNRTVYVEEVAKEYLRKLQKAIRKLLSDDSTEEEAVDFVVLAGGGSQMYGIEELLLGQLPIEDPLRLKRITRENGRLFTMRKEPSSICALGNVMPELNIPYRKHAFTGYRIGIMVYAVPVGMSSGWHGKNFFTELDIPEYFTRLYSRKWMVAEPEDALPIDKKYTVENQKVTIISGKVPVFILKLYSVKDEKIQFQRGWTFDTNRTLGTFAKDIYRKDSEVVHEESLNVDINVNIDEELSITISAKAKVKGYWGLLDSAEERKANG